MLIGNQLGGGCIAQNATHSATASSPPADYAVGGGSGRGVGAGPIPPTWMAARALIEAPFVVRPGERVALLGPDGAGKTTLVLHLNGILTPARGTITAAGLPVAERTVHEVRRRVGIVFQDPDDHLFMPTVAEDVAFGPANSGVTGAEPGTRVDEAPAAVGMLEHRDRSPLHLSGGQRRRVALATVLSCRPGIPVLDEPSSNLDPVAAASRPRCSWGWTPPG